MTDAYLHEVAQVARRLRVDPDEGLAADEVPARRTEYGANRWPEAPPRAAWQRFADQFRDVMILVLLAAAVLSGLLGDLADTIVIVVIVLLNAVIGTLQSWRADRALQALRSLAAPQATVRRDGLTAQIGSEHLVPGDVVLLEAGNLVPADLRLHEVAQLRVDESALTGESASVHKLQEPLEPQDTGEHPLAERLNMAYKGTLVVHGRAEGLVVATGMHTELGRIAGLLAAQPERDTPLQRRLAAFGRRLSIVVLAICVVVFAVGVLRGEPLGLMALTAISLAVAAIPEALPAVVTVLLALGARRMVRVNALVRRLPAVETLGSVSVICSDKTGTLTLNRMQVQRHALADGATAADFWGALVLCNDAQAHDAQAHQGQEGHWLGDPTETALLDAAAAAGTEVDALRAARPRLHEYPFDAERKRMSTLHADDPARAGTVLLVKGAPESVLPRCERQPQGAFDASAWLATAQAWAGEGLRVLAVARRRSAGTVAQDPSEAEAAESGLELLGLVALMDPPRPEVPQAVAECRAAGITPVMITGDHPATALAIARRIGLVGPGEAQVLTGVDLARLDAVQLAAEAGRTQVYARVDPAQKIRIVEALRARGETVAMTGDGVNDAPALKAADIGIAMGRGGTDVAREASALVLLDDHFASIVAAVREGRRIFDNIRKFVRYAMTGNSGEIWVLFLAPLLGLPIPLLPIHILWVNLVTDGLPGLALAAEPAERGVMQRAPRPPGESLFAHGLWQHCLWVGLMIAGLCLGLQAWAVQHVPERAQTLVFTALTLTQMAHVLAIRSERESFFTLGLASNWPLAAAVASTVALQAAVVYVPALQPLFRTVPLGSVEAGLCVGAAVVVFAAVEIEKAFTRRRRPLGAPVLSSTS